MKQITLTISSRDYTITLDDDFAEVFERDWKKFMGGKNFLEPREILNAFIEKSYENYKEKRALKDISRDIDSALTKILKG